MNCSCKRGTVSVLFMQVGFYKCTAHKSGSLKVYYSGKWATVSVLMQLGCFKFTPILQLYTCNSKHPTLWLQIVLERRALAPTLTWGANVTIFSTPNPTRSCRRDNFARTSGGTWPSSRTAMTSGWSLVTSIFRVSGLGDKKNVGMWTLGLRE